MDVIITYNDTIMNIYNNEHDDNVLELLDVPDDLGNFIGSRTCDILTIDSYDGVSLSQAGASSKGTCERSKIVDNINITFML